MNTTKAAIRTYVLRPCHELRILNDNQSSFDAKNPQIITPTVKLLPSVNERGKKINDRAGAGTAEIFGIEMLVDHEYVIKPNVRMAIYTWGGCSIQLKGNVTQEYNAPNNAMKDYMNFSYILDSRRELALMRNQIGPRVLVTGAGCSGKSSICSMLCNYALRTGWNPTFIELDPRCSTDKEQLGFLPGIIGATVIESLEDREPQVPICYYFGHTDVQEDTYLFLQQCECLSAAVYMHFLYNLKSTSNVKKKNKNTEGTERLTAASGFIINAPHQPSTNIILELVEIFGVNIIVVVDNPSMQFNMEEKFKYRVPEKDENIHGQYNDLNNQVVVLGFPKLDGVVSVDSDSLRYIRRQRWQSYFNGNIERPLRPNSLRIRFSDANFVTLDTFASLPVPSVTGSANNQNNEVAVLDWHGNPRSLLNIVLGIPACTEKQHISTANLACVVYTKNVEEIESAKTSEETIDSNEAGTKVINHGQFILDLWTPHLFEGKLMSNYFLVPADMRHMKWISDHF